MLLEHFRFWKVRRTIHNGKLTLKYGSSFILMLQRRSKVQQYILNCQKKLKDSVREALTPTEIGSNEGLDKIITHLDKLCMKNINVRTYLAFKEFFSYHRESSENMTDFFAKFEVLYNKLVKLEMKLPEGAQCFFLLHAANVTEENERLAQATCTDMTYKGMKCVLQRIFGDPDAGSNQDGVPEVKNEVLLAGRGNSSNYRKYGSRRGGKNFNNRRNVMTWYNCGSPDHLNKYCSKPRKNKVYFNEEIQSADSERPGTSRNNDSTVYITLLNSSNNFVSALVKESLGKGVLDTACPRNLMGESWWTEQFVIMSDKEQNLLLLHHVKVTLDLGMA